MTQYRFKNSEFDLAVLEFKKKFLLKLLKRNNNNILEVSRQTRLSRTTVYKIIGFTKKTLKVSA